MIIGSIKAYGDAYKEADKTPRSPYVLPTLLLFFASGNFINLE